MSLRGQVDYEDLEDIYERIYNLALRVRTQEDELEKLNKTVSESLKLLHETVKRLKALELNFSVF